MPTCHEPPARKSAPKAGARAADKPAAVDKEKDNKPASDKEAIQGVWHITNFEKKGSAA